MIKVKHLLLILVLSACPIAMKAQENQLKAGIRAGHNAAFGGFAAISVETTQRFCNNFSINGGVQYNTIGKTALEARPSYIIVFSWGSLSPEVLLTYTRIGSVNNFAAGAGADFDFGRWRAKLGYYYRLYGSREGKITEPFNIYYELSVNLIEKIEDWDLNLTITNNEIFELERHYQPTFLAECLYYPTPKLGVNFGIGCKPAGMFNMSADYYQSFIKTGVCYRW